MRCRQNLPIISGMARLAQAYKLAGDFAVDELHQFGETSGQKFIMFVLYAKKITSGVDGATYDEIERLSKLSPRTVAASVRTLVKNGGLVAA